MRIRFATFIALPVIATMASPVAAQENPGEGYTFHVNDPAKRNQITFKSEAPLEDIIGLSNEISGKIVFDPMKPEDGVKASFTVPTGSFTTGIPLRDEHLTGAAWLDASKHPGIVLQVTNVNKITTVSRTEKVASFLADVKANLTVRGKTQPVSFVARVMYLKEDELTKKKMPGDLLAIRAEFNIGLSSFGVNGPEGAGIVGTKVSDDITVSVNLFASNSPELAAAPTAEKKAENP